MKLIGANYRIRAITILFLILFLVSIIALILTVTITQLRLSLENFTASTNSNTYLSIKFENGHTRIATINITVLSLSIASDAIGTVISIILLKKQIKDLQLKDDKYALYLNSLYLFSAIGCMAIIVAFGYQLAIVIELEQQTSVGEGSTLGVLILALLLYFVIVTLILELVMREVPQNQSKIEDLQAQNKILKKIPAPIEEVFYLSNNPLRIEQGNTHHKNYYSTKKERVFIKSKKNIKKKPDNTKNKEKNRQQVQLNNIPTTKQPLLIADQPKKLEQNDIIKQQLQKFYFDEQGSDSIDAAQYPIAVYNSSMSYSSKQKVPKLKMELIKAPLTKKSSNSMSLNKLQISDILPIVPAHKKSPYIEHQMVIDPYVKDEQSQRKSILSRSDASKMPQQAQKKRIRPDLSGFVCNNPSAKSKKLRIEEPPNWVKPNLSFDQ